MAKVRITKQELRKQKDSLARFRRYLPTLQLKKKQLQRQILKVHKQIDEVSGQEEGFRNQVIEWVDVFAQQNPIGELLNVKAIKTKEGNVAGVDLPIFDKVEFSQDGYDFLITPFWVDSGIEAVKEMISYKAQLIVLHKQLDALKEELRITNQRVNLFEKVKIPETEDNIRIIQIYLGERRTAAVVRGKIAKAKIEQKKAINQ
ncbi:MAG: V-type ATP synthase subunit D [Candidatus Omnitrophica bacterium]|nr:V-type ATP synthase subunit D [Candidatus Omnitrophota bacterium]MCF7893681.1 V-type ATP synthase subunit D [Candidatus Omnitrophota bacterium]